MGDTQDVAAGAWAEVETLAAEMLTFWQAMQSSDLDDAGDDAERFEQSFYRLIDALSIWLRLSGQGIQSVADVLSWPGIAALRESLPVPLQLNFDTEIEDLCQARMKLEDDA